MGNGELTKHAQNLQGCEKCNLKKAVGNMEMPYGCEIITKNPVSSKEFGNRSRTIEHKPLWK